MPQGSETTTAMSYFHEAAGISYIASWMDPPLKTNPKVDAVLRPLQNKSKKTACQASYTRGTSTIHGAEHTSAPGNLNLSDSEIWSAVPFGTHRELRISSQIANSSIT